MAGSDEMQETEAQPKKRKENHQEGLGSASKSVGLYVLTIKVCHGDQNMRAAGLCTSALAL